MTEAFKQGFIDMMRKIAAAPTIRAEGVLPGAGLFAAGKALTDLGKERETQQAQRAAEAKAKSVYPQPRAERAAALPRALPRGGGPGVLPGAGLFAAGKALTDLGKERETQQAQRAAEAKAKSVYPPADPSAGI